MQKPDHGHERQIDVDVDVIIGPRLFFLARSRRQLRLEAWDSVSGSPAPSFGDALSSVRSEFILVADGLGAAASLRPPREPHGPRPRRSPITRPATAAELGPEAALLQMMDSSLTHRQVAEAVEFVERSYPEALKVWARGPEAMEAPDMTEIRRTAIDFARTFCPHEE